MKSLSNNNIRSINKVLLTNLLLSMMSFFLVFLIFLNFDATLGITTINIFNLYFYVDGLSLSLLFLNSLIFLLSHIYSYYSLNSSRRFHSALLLVIHLALLFCFITNNLLLFYIFFEVILIPMYILINVWGSRGRRVHASYLFFFFTFASSFFLLIGMCYLYVKSGTLSFLDFGSLDLTGCEKFFICAIFFIGFMAKIPMYPFHIWLPEAHVEAPTVGSVILAAILLKLGFYGMYRIFINILDYSLLIQIRPFFVTIVIISLIYSSMVVIRQIDLKKIIAYSSVVHMNFGLLGLFSDSQLGLQGSIFIMICHGLISGAMFFSVGMLYDRFHTRNIMYYGGLVQYMPIFSIFFFFIMISNMSFPGTCNFIGEFLVYLSIYHSNNYAVFFLSLISIFFTSLFCISIVIKVIFYQITGFLNNRLHDLVFPEFVVLFVLSIYIIIFGFYPDLFLSYLGVVTV
jgi:NADH-quinone oxidoreductase subunit M